MIESAVLDGVITVTFADSWQGELVAARLSDETRLLSPCVLVLDVSGIELPNGCSVEVERYCSMPLQAVVVICGSLANRWKIAAIQGFLLSPCPLVAVDNQQEAFAVLASLEHFSASGESTFH